MEEAGEGDDSGRIAQKNWAVGSYADLMEIASSSRASLIRRILKSGEQEKHKIVITCPYQIL